MSVEQDIETVVNTHPVSSTFQASNRWVEIEQPAWEAAQRLAALVRELLPTPKVVAAMAIIAEGPESDEDGAPAHCDIANHCLPTLLKLTE